MKESIILPEKVNLELAINVLNLSSLPLELALNTIISYSNSGWLSLYFNKQSEGLPHKSSFGNIYNENDELIDWEPIDTSLIKDFNSTTPKKIVTAHCSKGDEFIKIYSWEVTNEIFVHVDTTNQQQDTIDISLDDIYILKEDLTNFEPSNIQAVSSSSSTSTPVSNEMKALALIARELSDTRKKFQNGKKVNASSVKEYLITLADKYNVSQHGLKSIDDKLNRALNHFELNNINKSQ